MINDLAFSTNGEQLLVASGHAQIRILDRQGKQWAETVRGISFLTLDFLLVLYFIVLSHFLLGDQYLVDLSNTSGHTSAVNCCCWHPLIKTEFLSCGDDG